MICNISEYEKRLLHCGMDNKTAGDICKAFFTANDTDMLEKYVRSMELLYDDRRDYVE